MGTRHRDARRDLLEALDGRRYFRLLDALEELVDFPPLTPAAGRRAGRVLPKLAGRTVRRLRRDARRIRRTPPQRRERWLLEVGKDTEQVRYAAESLVSVIGKPAKRLAKAVKDAQEVLDEYRNSVGARQVLRELGVAAHLSGENGFSFGLMLGQEQARGDAAASRCPAAVKAATRKKLTRAMT
jgi:CHAD domain-containing protein